MADALASARRVVHRRAAGAPKPVDRRGKSFQFTAIDDCAQLRVLRLYPQLNQKTAIQFVDYVLQRLPSPVDSTQTDNGVEFASAFHWHLQEKASNTSTSSPAHRG